MAAILEIRYYGTYNFVGQRIDGYEEPTASIFSNCCFNQFPLCHE